MIRKTYLFLVYAVSPRKRPKAGPKDQDRIEIGGKGEALPDQNWFEDVAPSPSCLECREDGERVVRPPPSSRGGRRAAQQRIPRGPAPGRRRARHDQCRCARRRHRGAAPAAASVPPGRGGHVFRRPLGRTSRLLSRPVRRARPVRGPGPPPAEPGAAHREDGPAVPPDQWKWPDPRS